MAVHWGGRGPGHVSRLPMAVETGAETLPYAWPRMATTGGGLEALIIENGSAVYGEDFGRTASRSSPAAGSTHPQWVAASLRIKLDNTENGNVDNYDIDGRIEQTSTHTVACNVTDCIIEAAGGNYGIDQNISATGVLTAVTSDLFGHLQQSVRFHTGSLTGLYIHDMPADGLSCLGTGTKTITRCMIRSIGLGSGAHGDGIQLSSGASNLTISECTIYVPYATGPYAEGSPLGSVNNCIRCFAGTGDISNIFVYNTLLIGGSTAMHIGADTGRTCNSVFLSGVRMTIAGGDYCDNFEFYRTAGAGTVENIAIYDCKYLEDGTPVQHGVASDMDGLYFYNKATATAAFKTACQAIGYLDGSADPLVTNRTDFYT